MSNVRTHSYIKTGMYAKWAARPKSARRRFQHVDGTLRKAQAVPARHTNAALQTSIGEEARPMLCIGRLHQVFNPGIMVDDL